jgi:hypothetical protein
MKKFIQLIVLTLFMQAAVAQDVIPGQSAFGIGAYYAKGDFGQDSETTIRYAPATLEHDNGRWGLQLLVPRLEVEGPGTVLLNLGGISRAVASDEITVEQGLGDAVASLIYRFDPLPDRQTFVDLRLDVKLPTADEAKALGTGQADYSLQVDISRQQGAMTYFATAGYTYRGNSPVFQELRNGEFVQLGLAYPLSQRVSVGAIYDYRAAPAAFSDEIHELLPYAAFQLNENWSFSTVITTGFTDASADVSLLGQLRYSW